MMTTLSRWTGPAGWLLVTLIAVIYGPMAIEYFAHFYHDTAPQLWNSLFIGVTSESHVLGAGSVALEQHDAYRASLAAMTLHTATGGIVILLAAVQFNAGFRKRFPAWHRYLGRVHAGLVVFGMLSAMAYLLRTGPEATFDGPAFYLQLWTLALGTLASIVLAVVAILKRQVAMHYCLVALNLSLLMSAPGLRIGYLIFGGIDPTLTQEATNMASAIIYAFLVAPFAAVAARVMDKRPRSVQPAGQPVTPAWQVTIWFIGGVLAIAQGYYYQYHIGGWSWLHGALLLTALFTAALYGGALWSATRQGLGVARYEWSIHLAALGMVPLSCAVFWFLTAQFFTLEQAFWAAVLVGPAVALVSGLAKVIWSRRVRQGVQGRVAASYS